MATFIQSANSLVSRVASWVGAIPVTTSNTAQSYVGSSSIVELSAAAVGI